MKIATQHYQDSVITPYGNNHWNGKEKIDISKEKDDAVILEISAKGKRAIQLKEKNEFEQDIVQVDKSADDLPAYSGMYDVDKTISSSLENCSKEEQGFVYDIIRENFLIGNGSSMSEEERQANISLGMKKAEYAANNFISEDKKSSFLDAMESIAKLASAGRMNADGNMDYGVKKGNYLGHGSNLVYTTDGLDMMRSMDSGAYDEYQVVVSLIREIKVFDKNHIEVVFDFDDCYKECLDVIESQGHFVEVDSTGKLNIRLKEAV